MLSLSLSLIASHYSAICTEREKERKKERKKDCAVRDYPGGMYQVHVNIGDTTCSPSDRWVDCWAC